MGAYFGRSRRRASRARLVGEQLDGGWNLPKPPKSTRLVEFPHPHDLRAGGGYWRGCERAPSGPSVGMIAGAARRRGEGVPAPNALFRRLSDRRRSRIRAFLTFAFPPRYHYDVLRCGSTTSGTLVFSPTCALWMPCTSLRAGGRPMVDEAFLDDAYDDAARRLVRRIRGANSSRWNTLQCGLRVLRWYERRGPEPTSTP